MSQQNPYMPEDDIFKVLKGKRLPTANTLPKKSHHPEKKRGKDFPRHKPMADLY